MYKNFARNQAILMIEANNFDYKLAEEEINKDIEHPPIGMSKMFLYSVREELLNIVAESILLNK